eukprot:5740275-Prymnesium_polylepis.1
MRFRLPKGQAPRQAKRHHRHGLHQDEIKYPSPRLFWSMPQPRRAGENCDGPSDFKLDRRSRSMPELARLMCQMKA